MRDFVENTYKEDMRVQGVTENNVKVNITVFLRTEVLVEVD